jgi:protein-tyrosine phosphatase
MRTILIAILLSHAVAASAQPTRPNNFFQVDSLVSRGAEITQDNEEWLAERGVKTIIKLDDENPDEDGWQIPVENHHINEFGLNLSYSLVSEILDAIDSAEQHGGVYVHCQYGADRTGLIIALYRIKNGWTIEDARNEMNDPRFGHSSLQIWMDYKFEEYANRLVQERLGVNVTHM